MPVTVNIAHSDAVIDHIITLTGDIPRVDVGKRSVTPKTVTVRFCWDNDAQEWRARAVTLYGFAPGTRREIRVSLPLSQAPDWIDRLVASVTPFTSPAYLSTRQTEPFTLTIDETADQETAQ